MAKKLSEYPLKITQQDACTVLKRFFSQVPSQNALDENDRRFAQDLLLSAAYGSIGIGLIEALWKKASSPTAKPLGIIKAIAKPLLQALQAPRNVQDALNTDMYDIIINAISYRNRSQWEVRIQTDDSSILGISDASFTI